MHSLPVDSRGRDLSGHGKKSTDRGALTFWRRQRNGLVRTWKKTDRPRCTHQLETAEGGTCQGTERNRPTEVHSHSGGGRGRYLSGHGRKPTDRGALTSWRRQKEALVRTRKEIDQSRRTHLLETAEEETCRDMKRNRPIEVHSPTGDGRGRDFSGHGKKPTGRGALTSWRRQREGLVRPWKETDRPRCTHILEMGEGGLVRTWKEIDQSRCTHFLETAEGGTCQDMERNRPTEVHSLARDGRGMDVSGHGKKSTDRGALTPWRWQREVLVRTRKQTDRPRRTHILETAEEGTCQDTETNQATKAHSHPGDGRGGTRQHTEGNRRTEVHSHPGDGTERGTCQHTKGIDRPRRTHILETAEGGTCQHTKGIGRPRRTHILETAEGGTCQHTETNRLRCTHRLGTAEGGTCQHTKRNRLRCTHRLGTAEGGTCQHTKRNRPMEAHSHPRDGREGRTCQDMEKN